MLQKLLKILWRIDEKIIFFIIAIILNFLSIKILSIDTSNLNILILGILSIIANIIVFLKIFKNFNLKYFYILIMSLLLLNTLIYTFSGYFKDLLLYNTSYQFVNFLLSFIYIILNIYLFKFSRKKK